MKWKILAVDDEQYQLKVLADYLAGVGYTVERAGSKAEALEKAESFAPDVIVTDFAMPDGSGLELINEAKRAMPKVGSIIVTAYGTIRAAVEAIKSGVDNFIEKPLNLELLDIVIRNILEGRRAAVETSVIRDRVIDPVPGLIGTDPKILAISETISRVAPLDTSVLITGETGTGKEVAASLVWRASERAGRPFVRINCASIPESLFESELFGHEKGAFTGATDRKHGYVGEAAGGTILFDEIADMPMQIQPKLLRLIESREYFSIGSPKAKKADIRMLFATKADLAAAVTAGRFREDLYFRINVVNIAMPPLRERRGDIPALFAHFLGVISARVNRARPVLPEGAGAILSAYDWPGNVRELVNAAERTLIFSRPGAISADDIARAMPQAAIANGSGSASARGADAVPASDLAGEVDRLERAMITKALASSKSQTEAATRLGISERVLRYKIEKLGIR